MIPSIHIYIYTYSVTDNQKQFSNHSKFRPSPSTAIHSEQWHWSSLVFASDSPSIWMTWMSGASERLQGFRCEKPWKTSSVVPRSYMVLPWSYPPIAPILQNQPVFFVISFSAKLFAFGSVPLSPLPLKGGKFESYTCTLRNMRRSLTPRKLLQRSYKKNCPLMMQAAQTDLEPSPAKKPPKPQFWHGTRDTEKFGVGEVNP